MADTLEQIIAAIPEAEDGRLITKEYHNSLRAALRDVARRLDTGPSRALTSLNFAPNLLPITEAGATSPAWSVGLGIATKPSATASARGWFPVQLPDGATVRAMTVTGRRSGTVNGCDINLLRQTIANATTVPIINLSLRDVVGSPFKVSGDVSGASLPIINDFRTVDTDRYQYLVFAELRTAATDAIVDLFTIQITFVIA